jgi:hypothetical protein
MRVLALMAMAMLALSARAVADCPYAVVEIDMAPSVIVDESGAHVLRWQGPSFIYDPITVMDLDVQVVMEKQSFTAAYTIRNDSPRMGQSTRMYIYFENPTLEAPTDEEFVSAGLLGGTGPAGELGRLPSQCQMYKNTSYPSKSFGDFTSRHSLKPRSTENANVQGALKIRGNGESLAEITQHLASHPPKLKMLIWAEEARERK